jgi:hypothetical protein
MDEDGGLTTLCCAEASGISSWAGVQEVHKTNFTAPALGFAFLRSRAPLSRVPSTEFPFTRIYYYCYSFRFSLRSTPGLKEEVWVAQRT